MSEIVSGAEDGALDNLLWAITPHAERARLRGKSPSAASDCGSDPATPEAVDFLCFHEQTHTALAAYVQSSTRDPAVTQDVTQESYLRFLRAARPTRPLGVARAYLFRIATNLLRDRYRRRDLEFPVATAERDQEAVAQHRWMPTDAERRIWRNEVRVVLDTLAQRDRQLLWLAHVEQMSHREVAEVLGLREISIRPMLFRARKRFAAALRRAGVVDSESSS